MFLVYKIGLKNINLYIAWDGVLVLKENQKLGLSKLLFMCKQEDYMFDLLS